MTFNNLIHLLKEYQIPNPHLESLNLFELVYKLPQTKILSGDFKISPTKSQKIKHLAYLRKTTPLAYLKQNKEFYGLDFMVNPHVLIPRPESEDLIELALSLKSNFNQIYDIGCGSGCLGISYIKNTSLSKIPITFIDLNFKILKIAQTNCRRHQIQNCQFICKDLNIVENLNFPPFSLLLANLPYLDIELKDYYENNCPFLKSEPKTSLYAFKKGLEFYIQLFRLISQKPNLTLICESLKSQHTSLIKIASKYGFRYKQKQGLAILFISNP